MKLYKMKREVFVWLCTSTLEEDTGFHIHQFTSLANKPLKPPCEQHTHQHNSKYSVFPLWSNVPEVICGVITSDLADSQLFPIRDKLPGGGETHVPDAEVGVGRVDWPLEEEITGHMIMMDT